MENGVRYEIRGIAEGTPVCYLHIAELITIEIGGRERSPFRDFAKKSANREAANRLYDIVKRIEDVGIETSIMMGSVRQLKGNMYEIKDMSTTMRAYCDRDTHGDKLVVVGIEKQTHKAGNNQSQSYIDKYEDKIKIVESLLKEEKVNGN